MATEKWVTGTTSGWASAFGAEVNALTNGQSVLSSVSITAGSSTANYDLFADVSVSASVSTGLVAAPYYFGVYIYPLNEDGTTYGANNLTTTPGSLVPQPQYFAGSISIATSSSVQMTGTVNRVVLPPTTFRFALYNQVGATLTSSVTIKYQSYNRSVA